MTSDAPGCPAADALEAWARSGAMWLTGPSDGAPLGPPERLVPRLRRIAERIRSGTARLGREVALDPLALLGERAAIAGLRRGGTVSCGRSTRLLRAGDGWIVVSLPRPSDLDLLPAWTEGALGPSADPWDALSEVVGAGRTDDLVETGMHLGLAVAALPAGHGAPPDGDPVRDDVVADALPVRTIEELVVVDLSALWAGPLCGSLLAAAGAEVWKVESTARPDGARRGPAAMFDLLNAEKRSVALDLTSSGERRRLADVVGHADVVIEASRPRALEQLGIDARTLLDQARPRVWISITGHGRRPPAADRIAFGDDAAVAGGLVSWHGDTPMFCADAVADPLTGLAATAACLDALGAGGFHLLDVSMAAVARHHGGATLVTPPGIDAELPRARPATRRAPPLGSDTAAVLDRVDGGR